MSDLRLALRVAARYQRAKEFSSPDALKEYLHEHPQADKSKHTVKKPGDEKAEGKSEGPSEKATSWLSKAKGAVKSFFSDSAERRKMLTGAAEALEEAPAKLGKKAVDAVKAQVKDAKVAFGGVKAALTGKPVSAEQKTAMKTVGLKIAVAVAATALTSAVPGLGHVAGFVAKQVAQKAMGGVLGNLTGLKLAAEGADPEAWLATNVAKEVAKVLKDLSEADIQAILEEAAAD